MNLIILILILMLIGVFPAWPYAANWGYAPAGGLGFVLVIVLIFWLLGLL